MNTQGLTGIHDRLRNYLIEVINLETENFRFSDTYGQATANFDEPLFVSMNFAEGQAADTVDPVPATFDILPPEITTRMGHEYVLHLIISEFGGDFSLLLSQLLFWKAKEKQDITLDYKLSWNNDNTVDINFYFDIAERIKITEKDGVKTC
jgi:hypothetical protein